MFMLSAAVDFAILVTSITIIVSALPSVQPSVAVVVTVSVAAVAVA